jgi:hypothetical protein
MSNSHTTQRGVYDIGTATTEGEEQRPFPSRVNRYSTVLAFTQRRNANDPERTSTMTPISFLVIHK